MTWRWEGGPTATVTVAERCEASWEVAGRTSASTVTLHTQSDNFAVLIWRVF